MVSIFVVAHRRAPERIRTSDPRLRRPLLYPSELLARASQLVGASRFERPTTCAQGRCASRLRYAPSKVTRLPNTDSRPHATLARLRVCKRIPSRRREADASRRAALLLLAIASGYDSSPRLARRAPRPPGSVRGFVHKLSRGGES